MPSYMVLYFVHSSVKNLLGAIPTLLQDHDCARHIDLNMDNHHLRMIQHSECLMEPKIMQKGIMIIKININ